MRQEKQLLLDEIKEKLESSSGFVVSEYEKMDAQQSREFRSILAEVDGEFEVVKKRVFLKAAEQVGINLQEEAMPGHVGVVFAKEDITKISKTTVTYGEKNSQVVKVVAGYIDGQICSGQEVEEIAKLPSLDELRAQFVGLLEAPMSQTLAVFHAALTGLLYCLEEKAKKES